MILNRRFTPANTKKAADFESIRHYGNWFDFQASPTFTVVFATDDRKQDSYFEIDIGERRPEYSFYQVVETFIGYDQNDQEVVHGTDRFFCEDYNYGLGRPRCF